MKKFLPLIIFGVGLLSVILIIVFVTRPSNESNTTPEETATIEVALNDRPMASLTPTDDGHWLNMKVEKLLSSAKTMDYELLYTLPDGRVQGVPGTVQLKGEKTLERKLLLGSESSGKFRYDEGVKEGTLTLRFRNEKGKLMVKYSTKFAMLTAVKDLTSTDGKVKIALSKAPKKGFFVIMDTFGVPGSSETPTSGPYGVFTQTTEKVTGTIEITGGAVQTWDGTGWVAATTFTPGIFIAK